MGIGGCAASKMVQCLYGGGDTVAVGFYSFILIRVFNFNDIVFCYRDSQLLRPSCE
jgi:hypothetical protein